MAKGPAACRNRKPFFRARPGVPRVPAHPRSSLYVDSVSDSERRSSPGYPTLTPGAHHRARGPHGPSNRHGERDGCARAHGGDQPWPSGTRLPTSPGLPLGDRSRCPISDTCQLVADGCAWLTCRRCDRPDTQTGLPQRRDHFLSFLAGKRCVEGNASRRREPLPIGEGFPGVAVELEPHGLRMMRAGRRGHSLDTPCRKTG